ncbi:sodium:solute symporter family protein [Siminovitchia sp. FSL W7-1587]|uniref:sodium:solute symporter family protein n=1 Tax=Siminovitchia sp. FSL W7-1587 TaxID=2954699 RepID=UPI0030CEB829
MNAFIAISVIIGFFILNAVIIKLAHRKQDTLEEFAVGGRSFPWYLSMFGFIGAWYVGAMYTGWFADSANLGLFAQYLALYSLGSMVVMFAIVRPVWIWGKEYQLETNADLAALRYRSKKFGTFIAITTFLFWSPWLIVEIKTIGYLISAATYGTISFNVGLVLVSLFVVVYCWIGGARASAVGALVQGVFFTIVGTVLVLYLIVQAYGGILPMFKELAATAPELLVISDRVGYGSWSSAIIVGALGGMMMPGVFIRMYMAKNVTESKKAVLVVPLIGALFTILLLWLGLGSRLIDGFPDDAQAGAFWIADQFGGPISLGLMGVFALAASMSTISAATITAAVMIGKNILAPLNLSRQKTLTVSKIATLLVGLIAIGIATMEIGRLVSIILYVYDCIVQVAIPLVLGLFWKRGNVYGAFTGTITGMIVVLTAGVFPWLTDWAGSWSPGSIGLLYNLILYVAVSLLTKKQAHVEELFNTLHSYSENAKQKSEIEETTLKAL